MTNGLQDPSIIAFVFAPLLVTTTVLALVWWKQRRDALVQMDAPGSVLASAVGAMSESRGEWGRAMLAELSQIRSPLARWGFALGAVRVALFTSTRSGSQAGRNPVCGLLAIALPPLGLPLIYLAAVIIETTVGSPFSQSSSSADPEQAMLVAALIVKVLFLSVLAGVPLGFAGWVRRERMRWLSLAGMLMSAGIVCYFVTVMHFVAGGPNGD